MDGVLRFGGFELRASQRQVLREGQPVPLGARAFDLLATLAAQRDRVVPKSELLDTVWPGIVVEENTLQVHVSALRKALGPSVIATVPGRGYRFTAPLDGINGTDVLAAAAQPQGIPVAPTLGNLPLALAPLFGRDEDLSALGALLDESRLVTVVGAGGIGKSRLALAAARARANTSATWWIELAGLADPSQLPATLARALGLVLDDASVGALATALCTRRLLLVLDNCEHLLDDVAATVERLLRDAPGIAVLATSQEPLHIADEVQFRLRPLAVPGTASLAQARAFGSIALFEARARAADRRFQLDDANLPSVIEICRRLDGLPLAIELAAARVPTLGVLGVRERLDSRFKLLTAGQRTALRRHQTLAAALEWSHGLLDAGEQAVFRRLGVFAGGFSMAMAQAVCADGDAIDAWAVLDHASALVDKSLVVVDDGEPPRYRLSESARAFALERLAAAGETAALLQRHARAMLDRLIELDSGMINGELRTDRYAALLLRDLDNLRAAWAWARSGDAEPGIAIALAAHAGRLVSSASECADWLLAVLGQVQAGQADDAVAARCWLSIASDMAGRVPRDVRLAGARESLRLYRSLGRPREMFWALGPLCYLVVDSDPGAARDAVEEARALVGAEWPPTFKVALQRREAELARAEHRYERARALHLASIEDIAAVGDWPIELMARHGFIDFLWGIGALEEAAQQVDAVEVELQRRSATAHDISLHAANAVGVYLECGRVDDAWSVARRSLPVLHQAVPTWAEAFACLLWRRGHGLLAANVMGFVEALRRRMQDGPCPNEQRMLEQTSQGLIAALGKEAFERALAEGAAMELTALLPWLAAVFESE